MIRPFKIPIKIYEKELFIFNGPTEEELLKYIKAKGYSFKEKDTTQADVELLFTCQGFYFASEHTTNKNKSPLRGIWLRGYDKKNLAHVRTLMHESVHAAIDLLRYTGHELNEGSEEAYAYLAEYLYFEAKEKLEK